MKSPFKRDAERRETLPEKGRPVAKSQARSVRRFVLQVIRKPARFRRTIISAGRVRR
jgi:hypothetical protein